MSSPSILHRRSITVFISRHGHEILRTSSNKLLAYSVVLFRNILAVLCTVLPYLLALQMGQDSPATAFSIQASINILALSYRKVLGWRLALQGLLGLWFCYVIGLIMASFSET